MPCDESAPTCGCYLSGPACVNVSGSGTEADPFTLELLISGAAENGLQCLSDGLWGPPPMPTGAITGWGGGAAPAGWLACDGSAVSRVTYSALFGVIGSSFGAGDSVSTFNVPNFQGRFPVGVLGGDPNYGAIGAVGGESTHILTEAELASHNHTGGTSGRSADHTHSGTTDIAGSHVHTVDSDAGDRILITFTPSSIEFHNTSPTGGDQPITYSRIDAAGDHNHPFISGGASGDHTHAITSDGSGTAHNNLPPFLALNFIIKT